MEVQSIPPTPPFTPLPEIAEACESLHLNREKLQSATPLDKAVLIRRCMEATLPLAAEWVALGCQAKGIDLNSPTAADEWIPGPMVTLRGMRLYAQTLESFVRNGKIPLKKEPSQNAWGKTVVPVFPTDFWDAMLYAGISAEVWMEPGISPEDLEFHSGEAFKNQGEPPEISLVLGGGNVASIPPLDVLGKFVNEGNLVLLKMHPLNGYLGPIFEKALKPLIDAGYLKIIYGGVEEAAYAMGHPQVDNVHITGSIHTHDAIVWGTDQAERDKRKKAGNPILKKPITSELGNVSPVIILPGPYTQKELAFQAENVAGMLTNNAGFNCNAAKLVITWKDWDQYDEFLALLKQILASVPPRVAYYPGTQERYDRFTEGLTPVLLGGKTSKDKLPWTLLPDVPPEKGQLQFTEEAFCGLLSMTRLEAADEGAFLEAAVEFANETVWGTLNACLIVPPKFRKRGENKKIMDEAIANLRFGTIGINIWPAAGFVLMSVPWGGWQGRRITLEDPQSGLGWVHNTYLLDKAEKTVIQAPLTMFPKPVWFPSHKKAHKLGEKVVSFEFAPSLGKLPGILAQALRG